MAVERSTRISVIDVIDRVIDKGIVIEYEAHVSMLGIDLWTTIEGHVVMASIDTFIRYAPALRKTERLLARFPE
jgi:gas vesicle protein GvpA/GvpJ/GvpM family